MNDILKIHMYRRDVEEILENAPPKDSPLFEKLTNAQQNLIDALEHAEVEQYD